MWPWGHLAVGYFCYLAVVHWRSDNRLTLGALLAVAFGTQFPDLIDKPLAWSFAILPSGRSLAHSLLFAIGLLLVLYQVGRDYDQTDIVGAFAVGYISHIFSDLGPGVILGLLQGDVSQLTWTMYLLWPLLPAPPYTNDASFASHFAAFALEPYVLVQCGLFIAACGHWSLCGQPGLKSVRAYFS